MKIAVTGAAGFIGSHTCERLVAMGHDVVGIDSFDSHLYPARVKRDNACALMRTVGTRRFRLIEADICDRDAMRAALGTDVDVILHLAALVGVRPSVSEPLRYLRTNVHGTTVLLEICREVGIQRFVFASSSSVYGVRAEESADLTRVRAFREDDPCPRPASPYAASKRSGELMCSTYRDLFGIGVSSLRFFTVYGPRQRPDMAIHKFVRSIAEGEPITLLGDGSSRRDYTYVDDIVSGATAACERVRPGSYNIYNLGGTDTISLAELVRTIEVVTGLKAEIERRPMQPGDVPITYADITNARRDLDYRPTVNVREGIARFWEWYQRRSAVTREPALTPWSRVRP